MILESISSLISVDKIIIRENEKYVHFLTHLDESFIVPKQWQSTIYTSKHIAEFLTMKKMPIARKYLKTLIEYVPKTIKLSNGTRIRVTIHPSKSLRGNIMIFFESRLLKVIYSGPFVESRSILANHHFINSVHSGIDELYIDNTRAHSTDCETIADVTASISKMLKTYPGYTIHMKCPVFGYEDLIYSIAKTHTVYAGEAIEKIFQSQNSDAVFVDSIKEAKIIVGDRCTTTDDLKMRLARKRLTVCFVETNYKIKDSLEHLGLHQFHWTPHPSLFELYALINFVYPHSVHEIYSDMPTLPKFLTRLCRRKPGIEINYSRTENDEIDNFDLNVLENRHSSHMSNFPPGRNELPRNVFKGAKKNNRDIQIPPIAIIRPISRFEASQGDDIILDDFGRHLSALEKACVSLTESHSMSITPRLCVSLSQNSEFACSQQYNGSAVGAVSIEQGQSTEHPLKRKQSNSSRPNKSLERNSKHINLISRRPKRNPILKDTLNVYYSDSSSS